MGMLAEQLRSIIDGPLGTDAVTEEMVVDRVSSIQQHERRRIYGSPVYRDGSDNFFVDDSPNAMSRRQAVDEIKLSLRQHGRLDEKFDVEAMLAMDDQQKEVDAAEKKIGDGFKRVAKRYVDVLNKMTDAKWRVVSANESIFSLDSDESPKRAIDIYWEYDPGSQTATIYVEGPKGKQKAYARQKTSDISKRNYVDWLSSVLKEEIESIVAFALTEDDELVEGQLGRKLSALDVVIENQRLYGRSTTIGNRIGQVSADQAKWMVSKRIAQWVETRRGEKAVSVDIHSDRLWKFRDELEAQAYESIETNTNRGGLVEEIQGIIDEAAVVAYKRRVAKAPPMHVGGISKPKSTPSGTKVGRLFRQLVKALTRGGDWDIVIKELRKEGVPEKHINYAIRHKEVPYVYMEEVVSSDDLMEAAPSQQSLLKAMQEYLGTVDWASVKVQQKKYDRVMKLVQNFASYHKMDSTDVWEQTENAARKKGIRKAMPGQDF